MRSRNDLEDGRDWISHLPDSLLVEILSLLNMRDAVKTSLLSKRWRYLWMYTFNLDFDIGLLKPIGSGDEPNEILLDESAYIARFIDRTLILHRAAKIERFCFSLFYDRSKACQVDTWIRYAVRHHVKELDLDFFIGMWFGWEYHCLYKVPHSLLRCESLEMLSLKCCYLNWPSSVCFSSLKLLHFEQMILPEGMIEGVISCCPLLEDLEIRDCNTENDLIIKTDRELKSLVIEDIAYIVQSKAVLLIDAPKLLYLELKGDYPRAEYRISKLQSLVAVRIEFEEILHDIDYEDEFQAIYYDPRNLKGVLNCLCHVKDMKLCSQCIQIMSTGELTSCLDTPPYNIICLELKTGLHRWELPGICHLLKSCPNIEALILRADEPRYMGWLSWEEFQDYDKREYWKWLELRFPELLLHLKTVHVYGLIGRKELVLQTERENAELFRRRSCAKVREFVRILLKNSSVLEKMTVSILRSFTPVECLSIPENSKRVQEVTEKLLAYPRASLKVGISITQS